VRIPLTRFFLFFSQRPHVVAGGIDSGQTTRNADVPLIDGRGLTKP
jgi:hypothetical protein